MTFLKQIAGRLLVYGVVALVAGVAGYYYAQSAAAEARTEAVMEAQREADRRLAEAVDRAQERARAHLTRVERLRREVRELESAAQQYAASEAGQKECLDPEGRARWNEL